MKIQTALSTLFVTGAGLVLIGQVPIASAGPGPGADDDDQAEEDPTTKTHEHEHTHKQAAGDKVKFQADSPQLDAEAQTKLDEIASWAMEDENRTVVIAGHTDAVGTQQYNQELGTHRAMAAREYLVQAGVSPDRIQVLSYGEDLPIEDVEGAENRRDIFLVEREQMPQQQQMGQQPIDDPAQDPMARDQEPMEPMEPREPEPVTRQDPTLDPELDEPDPFEEQRQPIAVQPPPVEEEESDRPGHLVTPAGMSISLGGGILDYIDDDTRDFTGTAGMWEARLAYGTRSPIGIEAGYVGFAQTIDALGLDSDARLLGSLFEGAVRLNVPVIEYFSPYVFGGVGYTRVDVVNEDFNNSNVKDNENAVHIPVGVGLGFRFSGLLFDIRGTVRPTIDDELVDAETITDDADNRLHNWSAGAKVGWEF